MDFKGKGSSQMSVQKCQLDVQMRRYSQYILLFIAIAQPPSHLPPHPRAQVRVLSDNFEYFLKAQRPGEAGPVLSMWGDFCTLWDLTVSTEKSWVWATQRETRRYWMR